MLFIKYLSIFFVHKNQFLFELENIYKKTNLCLNSQIYLENITIYLFLKKSYPVYPKKIF